MRTFGTHRPIPTAEEAYNDGHKTGVTWRHSYYPGGSAAFGAGIYKDPDWVAWCAATQENAREWLRGFDDARATK